MDTSLAESDPAQSEQRGEEHYSLRWNNHQSHILSAFDALLQAETLVDVTLVCAETSVRAHKVVLSACSPFFQRIFSETPCKHPVIVLKDFRGWEVQAIVDFMYRGEISVRQERLRTLIRAGESLQVRGLVDHPAGSSTADLHHPAALDREDIDDIEDDESMPGSPSTSRSLAASPALVDLMPPLDFVPALPRRKQARPRRRSGESAQDLTQSQQQQHQTPSQQAASRVQQQYPVDVKPDDSEPEDLCVKRATPAADKEAQNAQQQHQQQQQQQHALSLKDVRRQRSMKTELELAEHQLDLSLPPGIAANFAQSLMMHGVGGPHGMGAGMDQRDYPSPPLSLPPMGPGTGGQLGPPPRRGSPPLHFPQMPSVSALTLTPPHMFGLDSPLGLFPPGMDPGKHYSPLLDLDPRGPHGGHMDNPPYSKKKRRPKGQHSAPRGGPPRSWTNAELTEALQHVWNKKMTTSQASRIFGIPYNSLLMYVRGKYGKSLKLEQLRKDCIGGPPLELLTMGAGNNNNNGGKGPKEEPGPCPRPPSSEPDALCSPGPMFNPFPPGFYPDFVGGSGFPGLPLSMLHLLPPGSERMLHPGREPLAGLDYSIKEDDCGKRREMEEEDYSPMALSRDERRELIQHNGQD